jgi:hypothetical protein
MVRNTSREYQRMSPEDQRRFDGWMKANAVLGFILFLGMVAMAWGRQLIVLPPQLLRLA